MARVVVSVVSRGMAMTVGQRDGIGFSAASFRFPLPSLEKGTGELVSKTRGLHQRRTLLHYLDTIFLHC